LGHDEAEEQDLRSGENRRESKEKKMKDIFCGHEVHVHVAANG